MQTIFLNFNEKAQEIVAERLAYFESLSNKLNDPNLSFELNSDYSKCTIKNSNSPYQSYFINFNDNIEDVILLIQSIHEADEYKSRKDIDVSKNFQPCAKLEIEDLYNKDIHPSVHVFPNKDGLADLMNLQKNIQETVYGHDYNALQSGNLRDMKKFIDWNEEAIRDEFREFQVALGGIHSHAEALWKPWKSKHKEAGDKPFSELTPDEVLELKFEWIDMLHFMFNIALAIGLTPQEVYNMYYAKNKENRDRQNKPGGY